MRNVSKCFFDTEILPTGDFILWLKRQKDTIRIINPSLEWLDETVKRGLYHKNCIKLNPISFMEIYLYLSGLKFKRKGYTL